MFIPPWYPTPVTQLVPKPTTEFTCKKLQYPIDVKDINLNAHIKVFKKTIKTNGQTMEANIINMFGFILRNYIQMG
jgi:hypothetical protein